jgi:hypothetical protein
MAASSNSNQINLTANSDNEVTVSGTVVLLKDESLTLANGSPVNYANYGNYKALKVTDSLNNVQYICSLKGVKDVIKFAVTNSSGSVVEYPVMQHSFEYSSSDTPLADFDDRENRAILYDGTLGGSQSRTQRFNDVYQIEISGTYQTKASYDYFKGAKIGDTVTIVFYKNQTVKVARTSTIHNDGRLAELSGNSDIYEYLIKSVALPNDERVDGNKTYTNSDKGVWSVRPGINKIIFGIVTSNNKKALKVFIDAQGFRTGGSNELGWTIDTFGDNYGSIKFNFYDKSLSYIGTETLVLDPNTPGYDKCGRFLGKYVTESTFDTENFPIYAHIQLFFGSVNVEYTFDTDHFWSEYDAGYGSINATNPDIMSGEQLDDPWCLDRQYSTECNIQLRNDFNPWQFYRFKSDKSGSGGGTLPSTITTEAFNQMIVNQKIQYTGSVTKQTDFIVQSTSDYQGIVNNYSYTTKKFKVSTSDRPSMIRTVSMTYRSKNPLNICFYDEKNNELSTLLFNGTEKLTGELDTITETKVVGLRAKSFYITLYGVGSTPETLEIFKVNIAYG